MIGDSIKKIVGEKNLEDAIEQIMSRVYVRVAGSLTEQDFNQIKMLDRQDDSGNLVEYFMISKIPNFYDILKEEVNAHVKQMAQNK